MLGETDGAARELERRAEKWTKLALGSENERATAEHYYREQVMPLLKDVFVRRESGKITKEYEAVILSVGESYPPLVLSIAALRPKKVCFLVTEQSLASLDIIVPMTGLRASAFDRKVVDKNNPLQIYQAIKSVYEEWGCPGTVAVDLTGGTKVMSVGRPWPAL